MAVLFPFEKIPRGGTVALYGAGNCGRQFYKQLIATGYARVALWVDARAAELRLSCDYPVSPISDLANGGYDYVIVAVCDETAANEIAETLAAEYALEKEKILTTVHMLPEHTLYADQRQEYEYRLKDSDELIKIAPAELVKSIRLDTMVRYLVCHDIVQGIENNDNMSLYSRMLLCRGSRNEGAHYFQETARFSTQDFIREIRKMCCSMRDDGFNKEYYVPLASENHITLNGQHRVAAALALEKEIWARYYPGRRANENFNFDWFVNNGFESNDMLRILRAFADVYRQCGMILLYAPCEPQWGYILKQLAKTFTVVGFADLDFTRDYIAFENLMHDMYNDPLWRDCYMDRKLRLLKMSPLKVRVVLLSDENSNYEKTDFYASIREFKLSMRDAMFFETGIAPIVMHGSDTREEFCRMKRILLSPNNILNLSKRVSRNYREEFPARIDKVKTLLDENHIKHEDAVIIGSGVMEAFGLRHAGDLDVAVKKSCRTRLGYETFRWAEDIHYARINSIEDTSGKMYPDDLLINDDNLHFMFCGLKFINLELLKQKKACQRRENDVEDLRLIGVFEDYWRNYDDKQALQRQINKEIYLKRL